MEVETFDVEEVREVEVCEEEVCEEGVCEEVCEEVRENSSATLCASIFCLFRLFLPISRLFPVYFLSIESKR